MGVFIFVVWVFPLLFGVIMLFPSQKTLYSKIEHFVNVHQKSKASIRPHFWITGPTGTGKSYLTKTICESMGMPFTQINAAQLTVEGASGNSLSKALRPLRNVWNVPNIIFIDEMDKLLITNGEIQGNTKAGVQDELLHIMEATHASVFTDYGKYEPVCISNSLFIFAGAFGGVDINTLEQLKEIGLRTEFLGRVSLLINSLPIPLAELIAFIEHTTVFNAYLSIYPKITKEAAKKGIAARIRSQHKTTDLGARTIITATHQYFAGVEE